MPSPNEKPLTPPIAQTAAALLSTPGALSNELAAELLKAIRMQNAEAEKKQQEFETRMEYEKNHKKQLAKQLNEEKAKNIKNQESCLHTYKGETLLAGLGTWDSSEPPYFVCQSCMKEWHKEWPPGHLRPISLNVGRPQVN